MAQGMTVRWDVAAFVLIVLSSLVAALVLMAPTAHLTSVLPRQVEIFKPNELGLPRQAAAADQIYRLDQKRTLPKGALAQFQIPIDQQDVSNGQAFGIIISGIGAPSTLFYNAIGIGLTQPQAAPSSARGGYWASAQLPARTQNDPKDRLDLVGNSVDVWGTGIGGIKIGNAREIERALKDIEFTQQIRRVVFGIVGLLGLGYSIFCLVIARTFWAGVSGLLLSLVLLSWYFSQTFSFGLEATTALRASYGLASLTTVIAASRFSGRLGGVWLGLGIFGCGGTLSLMLGWRVGMPFELVASLSELAPIALCTAGLPLCVASIVTQLTKERSEARAEAQRQRAIVVEQAQELERQADREAVTQERKRFARDIHDGIGGQLVSLLWRVRAEPIPQEELAAEIEQGLADLRLVVDALDDGPVSLPIALANFAYRARDQLQAADIAFEWDLPLDLDVTWSDSRQILSLYRILQETVSNVMRHAQAKNLVIRFRGPDDGTTETVRVTIEDDGRGFDPNTSAVGRGLANMRTRAGQIGGAIQVTSPILPIDSPKFGTRITITLPSNVKIS